MDERAHRITDTFGVPSDGPRVAKAGHFYGVPEFLGPEMIDPLLWPIVRRINASGCVWTAESCQGHPDATELDSWASNVDVMLRLVTHESLFGLMLGLLFDACTERCEPIGSIPLRCYPHDTTLPWREVLVYLQGQTVAGRARAIDALTRFADSLPGRSVPA